MHGAQGWKLLSVGSGEVPRQRTERYFDVSGQTQRPVETSTGTIKLSQLQDAGTTLTAWLFCSLVPGCDYYVTDASALTAKL